MATAFGKVPCPVCGAVFDLEQAWDDADGRRFVELLTKLPGPVIRPFYNYLKLFKPAHQSLRWNRVLKLAQELAPMIHSAQVKRNGISYAAPAQAWAQAMDDLVRKRPESLTLPLKTHGYLLSILANQGEKQAAQAEQKQEEQKRNRGRTGADNGLAPVATVLQQKKTKRSKPPENWRPDNLPKRPKSKDNDT